MAGCWLQCRTEFQVKDGKADLVRTEFQIKAVNDMEAATIRGLERGMKVVISIADGFVVRFSVLGATLAEQFVSRIQEQMIVHDLARNQLIAVPSVGESE